ncbi:MAG: hypothetical protein GY871_15185, partial [Actinomycetales bacterium]|nr:hypothetical protein [Actinomycetales bacterium]
MNTTGKLLGFCPLYKGMRVRLTAKLSAKHGLVHDAAGTVKDVILHERDHKTDTAWQDPQHEARQAGYAVLKALPLAVLVEFDDSEEDVGYGKGVAVVEPHVSYWKYRTHENLTGKRKPAEVSMARRQIPLAPEAVRTVQTAQGMSMDAAMIFMGKPGNMDMDDYWMHLYVMISRVRRSEGLLAFDVPALKVFERGPPPWVGEGIARLEERARESSQDIAKARASLRWGGSPGGSGDGQGGAGPRSGVAARGGASGGGDADAEEEAFGALLQHAGVGAESGSCDMESGDVRLLTFTYTDLISRRPSGIGGSGGARSGPDGCRDICLQGDVALLAKTSAADRTVLGFDVSGDPEGLAMFPAVGGGFSNPDTGSCFVNAPLQLFLRLEPVAKALAQLQGRADSGDDGDWQRRLVGALAGHASDIRAGSLSSADFLLEQAHTGCLGRRPVQKAGGAEVMPPAGDATVLFLGDSHAKGEHVGLVDVLTDSVPSAASGKRAKGKRAAAAAACSGGAAGGGGLFRRALFGGVVRERQYCRRCEKATDVLRGCHRIDLKCSGSSNSSVTLQDLLDTWGGSLPAGKCERGCEGNVTQVVRYLEKEPPVLVLVINRTDGQKGKQKCTRAVRFPEKLDAPVVRSGRYSLAGVLQHQGEKTDRGHFVATCALGSGGYVVCDDEEVSQRSWGEVATPDMWRSVHVLVYARQTAAPGACEGVAATPYLRDPSSTKVARALAQEAVRAGAGMMPPGKRLSAEGAFGARNVSARGAPQVPSDLERSEQDIGGVGPSASASASAAGSPSRTRRRLTGKTPSEALSPE